MAPERERQFRMNLSDDELAMLRELAEADGITASDFLRMQIRRQYGERFDVSAKVKPKPKPKRK